MQDGRLSLVRNSQQADQAGLHRQEASNQKSFRPKHNPFTDQPDEQFNAETFFPGIMFSDEWFNEQISQTLRSSAQLIIRQDLSVASSSSAGRRSGSLHNNRNPSNEHSRDDLGFETDPNRLEQSEPEESMFGCMGDFSPFCAETSEWPVFI